jgi:hypothetical protein
VQCTGRHTHSSPPINPPFSSGSAPKPLKIIIKIILQIPSPSEKWQAVSPPQLQASQSTVPKKEKKRMQLQLEQRRDEDTGAQVAPIVKLEEVAVTTGEEDEEAILDLYVFGLFCIVLSKM